MQETSNVKLSENMIIADADYIDYVAFQLTVQFERMIGRAIPPADLSRWVVNMAGCAKTGCRMKRRWC